MARIRTIKPELFRHYELWELEQSTGLPIIRCWCALFTVCDREGRFRWEPRTLKLDCAPYDEFDFSRVLSALQDRKFIIHYEVGGKSYGFIPTFLDHQHINQREAQSTIPSPAHALDVHVHARADTTLADMPSMCMHVHARGEGKGREKEKEEEGSMHASLSRHVPTPEVNVPMEMNAHGTLTEYSVSTHAENKIKRSEVKEKGDTHGKFTESTEPPTSPSEPSPYPNPPSWDKNAPTSPLGGKNGHPEKTPRDVNAVREYAATISATDEEADSFFDHFTSNGWKVSGRTPMRDWQAAFRNWHRRNPKIPTADEVKHELIDIRGWSEQDAVAFYAHYSSTSWKDKNGNPITNWLAKAKTWQRNSSR